MKRRALAIGMAVIVLAAGVPVAWTWNAHRMRAAEAAGNATAAAPASRPSRIAEPNPVSLAASREAPRATPNKPLRPLPPPGAPLRTVLASLKQQAAEGDAAAACRIAFELERCAKLPRLRNLPGFWAQGLDRKTGKPRDDARWQVESARRRLADAESACEGLPADELAWTFDYALASAIAGNREARWMLSSWPVGLDVQRPERTLEGWARWREHIAAILVAGVAAGDPRIMRMASRAYTEVTWGYRIFPEDPVRAVALQFAIDRAASDGYRGTEANNGLFMAREASLDAAQVDEARRIASSMSTAQAPEGGVDWSRGMNPSPDGTACERER